MSYRDRVYAELIDFIAENTPPEKLAAFRVSEATQRRVGDLIDREKNEGLSSEETEELDLYMGLGHVMGLAKAKAYGRTRA
jgi:hypothetical protein